jgi:hypothetical protein
VIETSISFCDRHVASGASAGRMSMDEIVTLEEQGVVGRRGER